MGKLLSDLPAGTAAHTRVGRIGARARRWTRRPVSTELLIVAASLFFSLFCNLPFWSAVLGQRDWSAPHTWLVGGAMFAIVTAIHGLALGLVINRWTARPVLVVLFLVTAVVMHYMRRYHVFFDPGMLRNILHTDVKEARELVSNALLADLFLYGVIPGILLLHVDLAQRPWRRAIAARAVFIVGSLIIVLGSGAVGFKELSATMRNHKEVRYLLTPGNYLASAVRVVASDTNPVRTARIPVGADAMLAASWTGRSKPVVLVVVVGETARAANWGLNGYARQTTPHLASADVINYPHVTACGTNTEVSVPCMFSPFGRKNYDEGKIRTHESLLHVLDRSGFQVLWRDNQSGCKGVCDGLALQRFDNSRDTALCDGERCLDEILLDRLTAQIDNTQRNTVIVLHQLGNHGPAYARRYPDTFHRFTPTCDTADLGQCTQQQIINSYDNALLYTDYFLDQTMARLNAQTTHDAAMIYVSDHGESLGDNGFYLHGLPYAIAPKEQIEVPMVVWLSNGFASSFHIDPDCMKKHAVAPISHDYLFHSILGLLQVATKAYDKSYDLSATCRA